jgi:hypothetical protein
MAHLAHHAIDFFDETITAFNAEWTYASGENTLIADPDYTFRGVIQPASDASLQSLPEAQRLRVTLTLHTRTELKLSAPGQNAKNTYIRYQGKVLKVINLGLYNRRYFYRYGLESVESMDGR